METSSSPDDSTKQVQHLQSIEDYRRNGGAVTLTQLEELERWGMLRLDASAHLTLGFDLYVIRDNHVCTTSWPGFAVIQAGRAFWTETDAESALFLITAKSQISPITEAQWQHLRPGTPVFIITVADGMATGVNESQVTHADALDHCQQCWHQLKGRAFFTIVAAHATWLLQCQAQTLPVTVEQAHSLHPGDVLYQNSPCHTEPFTWVSWSQQKRRIKRGNCFFTRTAAVAAYDATRPQADGETARQARVASYRTSTLPMTKAEAQDLRYGMDIWTISATGEPQPLQVAWPECPNHMPDSFTNLLLSQKLFWNRDAARDCGLAAAIGCPAPTPVATVKDDKCNASDLTQYGISDSTWKVVSGTTSHFGEHERAVQDSMGCNIATAWGWDDQSSDRYAVLIARIPAMLLRLQNNIRVLARAAASACSDSIRQDMVVEQVVTQTLLADLSHDHNTLVDDAIAVIMRVRNDDSARIRAGVPHMDASLRRAIDDIAARAQP